MVITDSLHITVHFIVSSGVPFCCPLLCRHVSHARAFAPHLALSSHVQTSCLEQARPTAIDVFPGGLSASSTAPPGRRRPERQRRAKAEGKTKGGGTWRPATSVCTWGVCGTMRLCRRAVRCMKPASTLRYRRASYDEARHPLLGAR
jgi:hypothetical protein